MRIEIRTSDPSGELLKRRLELEGHLIPTSGSGESFPEFVLGGSPTPSPGWYSGEQLTSLGLGLMGIRESDFEPDFYVAKQWKLGEGFGRQTFLGIPVMGMMNGGLGKKVATGLLSTWLTPDSPLEPVFGYSCLETWLGELGHSGWLAVWMSSVDGLPTGLETGLPSWGVCNVLEGRKGTIGEALVGSGVWLESWVASVVVSRAGWGQRLDQSWEETPVRGLSERVENHFWLGDHKRAKQSIFVRGGLVGVASAWTNKSSPWNLEDRLLGTCSALEVEEVQYRTDVVRSGMKVWERIRALG